MRDFIKGQYVDRRFHVVGGDVRIKAPIQVVNKVEGVCRCGNLACPQCGVTPLEPGFIHKGP